MHEYESKHPPQFVLIECETNHGQGHARNTGLDYVTGNFVAFLDADDTIPPDYLAVLYAKMVLQKCDVVRCGYQIHNEDGTVSDHVMSDAIYDNLCDPAQRKAFLLQHGFLCGNAAWGNLFRTAFLRNEKLFFPEGVRMEDIFFHEEWIMKATRVYITSETCYHYRSHYGSVMQSEHLKDYYLDTFFSKSHL